jgi:hypothetical protein
VSKIVRRLVLVAALALAVVPLSAIGSGAQEQPTTAVTLTVKKVVVVGTGTGPSAVTVDCEGEQQAGAEEALVLNFDAQGNPTTTNVSGEFQIVDGAWVDQFDADIAGHCDYTETATGGASSTAWTCAYTFDPVEVPEAQQVEQAGCAADSGTGVGPAHVEYPGPFDVSEQASTVVFTNTFDPKPANVTPAPQVVAQPAFTG